MAADPVRSLRVLADIRRRRGTVLERALADQRATLEQCAAASLVARSRRDDSVVAHLQAVDLRARLFDQPFTPVHVRSADIAIVSAMTEKAEAEKLLKRCEQTEQRQLQDVQVAQAALRRNTERISRFEEQIEKLLAARQTAEDEAADEEAGEEASARIGRQRRVTKEAVDA